MGELRKAIERAQEKIWEGEGISQLPEVRKFLETNGLTSIRELDAEGKRSLHKHLTDTLELLSFPVSENKIN